jgi:predicted enzyme related to lactoylglutathione lyase
MRLGAITLFARDVDALAQFYRDALGLGETVDDSPRYRELDGGGARVGFAFAGAYDLLDLTSERDPTGLRSVLTFDVAAERLDAAVERAVASGARVIKPPFTTHFGARMTVLVDPEGNAFRLNAARAA